MKLFALSPIAPSCSLVFGLRQLSMGQRTHLTVAGAKSQFLRLIQEVLDGRRRPLTAAARGSFAHRLELGADRTKRHVRIRHGDAGRQHHEAILRRATRRPLQQFGVREPLPNCSSDRAPQALDGPAHSVGLVQHAYDVFPRVLRPHAPDRRQPSVHRGDDVARECEASRRGGLGDGGGIPRPQPRISGKLPARPRRLDARFRALGNQRPLKLSHRAQDLERKHALGRRGVDGVA